jgi:hypothetical protein
MALFLSSGQVLSSPRRIVRSMACALHLRLLPWRPLPVKHLSINLVLRDLKCSSSPVPFISGTRIRGGPVVEKLPSWWACLEAEVCESMHMFGVESARYLPRATHEFSTRFIIPYFLPAIFNKEKPPVGSWQGSMWCASKLWLTTCEF